MIDIPIEILLRIFHLIDRPTKLYAVCHKWNEVWKMFTKDEEKLMKKLNKNENKEDGDRNYYLTKNDKYTTNLKWNWLVILDYDIKNKTHLITTVINNVTHTINNPDDIDAIKHKYDRLINNIYLFKFFTRNRNGIKLKESTTENIISRFIFLTIRDAKYKHFKYYIKYYNHNRSVIFSVLFNRYYNDNKHLENLYAEGCINGNKEMFDEHIKYLKDRIKKTKKLIKKYIRLPLQKYLYENYEGAWKLLKNKKIKNIICENYIKNCDKKMCEKCIIDIKWCNYFNNNIYGLPNELNSKEKIINFVDTGIF